MNKNQTINNNNKDYDPLTKTNTLYSTKFINNNILQHQPSSIVNNTINTINTMNSITLNSQFSNDITYQTLLDNSTNKINPYEDFGKTLSKKKEEAPSNIRDSKQVKIKKITKKPVASGNPNKINNQQNINTNKLKNQQNIKTDDKKRVIVQPNLNKFNNSNNNVIQKNMNIKTDNNVTNKNIKKNNEDDSDDESEDYGNADDDDFDNILKESINIRKTQHAINLKNNLSQNPFLNKSNNNTNPTKKNIENKGNNNTNNNNLNKVKQIPNQIKQNLNKKTGDINLNQELNKGKGKVFNTVNNNLNRINNIEDQTEKKVYQTMNNYFDKIGNESDKKNKKLKDYTLNIDQNDLIKDTKINNNDKNVEDLKKGQNQNFINLNNYFEDNDDNNDTYDLINDNKEIEDNNQFNNNNNIVNDYNKYNNINSDYTNNSMKREINNMNTPANNLNLYNNNFNENNNNINNNNNIYTVNNNIYSNDNNIYNNNIDYNNSNNYNNNYSDNYNNPSYNNDIDTNNNIYNNNIHEQNNIDNNYINNNNNFTPQATYGIDLNNSETKNQLINHNISIDHMLKEINFLQRLKSISDSRYSYFIEKYQKENYFMEKSQFENIFIDEKDIKVKSPLTLIFHYIFNPATLLQESNKNFFETIFTKRGDRNYAMTYDQFELEEIPKYFNDFSYVNNLFNNYNKDDLNLFLNEINSWKETFSFEQQFIHPLYMFRREKSITMRDVAKVYFISPYDLIIDYHSYGSDLPLSDTFIAITQYRFHCDINFDYKKGKFVFKTSGKIFNTIKLVKETLLKKTIRNESNNTNKEELQINTWPPLKSVIESEDQKNQKIVEQIYQTYLLNNLNKYSKILPKEYDIFNAENEENWNSFSDLSDHENETYRDNYAWKKDLEDKNLIILKYVIFFIIFLLVSKILWSIVSGMFSFRSLFNSFLVILLGYILIKFGLLHI